MQFRMQPISQTYRSANDVQFAVSPILSNARNGRPRRKSEADGNVSNDAGYIDVHEVLWSLGVPSLLRRMA